MNFNSKVVIILVNYKSWQDTAECLESVFKLSYPNFKVIVVDNNSEDGSLEKLKNWAEGGINIKVNKDFYDNTQLPFNSVEKPIFYQYKIAGEKSVTSNCNLTFIQSKKNLGFAGGNNIAIKEALQENTDYIWLLNNDTVVPKDTLNKLVDFYQKSKEAKKALGVLGATLVYYHNPSLIQALWGRYKPLLAKTQHIGLNDNIKDQFLGKHSFENNDYIVGASMFVSTSFILEVGLLSEDYFLYFEEIDWVQRARQKSYVIDSCTDAIVYHKEGASIGGSLKDNNNKSELSDFYSIRNRLIITKKFYKKYLPTVYLSLLFVAINRLKRKQFNRIPLIIKAIKST